MTSIGKFEVKLNRAGIGAYATSESVYRALERRAKDADSALSSRFKRPASVTRTLSYDGRARVDVSMSDMASWDFKYQRFQRAVMSIARVS